VEKENYIIQSSYDKKIISIPIDSLKIKPNGLFFNNFEVDVTK